MKKNYIAPYAEMNAIASRDVIALSFLGEVNIQALESEELYKRDMVWDWTAK